jgi:hypothetical protein
MFLKYVNIPVFVLSFAFGMFAVYVTMPDTKKIIVYPSPDNVDVFQYKDKAENCFQFKQTSISCPTNSKDISKIPAQTQ